MAHKQDLQQLLREIEQRYMPERGWCDETGCTACTDAERQVLAAQDAARRAFYLQNKGASTDLAAQRRIFDQGYEQGRGEGLNQAHSWAHQRAQQAALAAKATGYQQGLRDGRASAAPPPQLASANEKQVRSKVVDEALNECHVIGESNPQMKPAANAIRHRIKKLRY